MVSSLLSKTYLQLQSHPSVSVDCSRLSIVLLPGDRIIYSLCRRLIQLCVQNVPLVLSSGSVSVAMQPALMIFSFELADGSGEGTCLIPNLDLMTKMLLPLMGSAAVIMITLSGFLCTHIHGICVRNSRILSTTEHDESSSANHIEEDLELDETPNDGDQSSDGVAHHQGELWQTMLWLAALFVYSPVSKTILKMVDCRTIGGTRLLYYAPTYKCYSGYGPWQYLVFFCLAAVLMFPGLVVFRAWRNKQHSLLCKLAQPYMSEYWFWGGVQAFRKLILILVSIIGWVTIQDRRSLLACACVALLVLHVIYKPYVSMRVNRCETVQLLCLSMIAILSMLSDQVTILNESKVIAYSVIVCVAYWL